MVQDLPGEVWKDVVGFEDHYMISNKGRCKSKGRYINNKSGKAFIGSKLKKICKRNKSEDIIKGRYSLTINYQEHKYRVIDMMYEAFVGPIPKDEILEYDIPDKLQEGEVILLENIHLHRDVVNLPDEVWKDVVGFYGKYYSVSNKGRVKQKDKRVNSNLGHPKVIKGGLIKCCESYDSKVGNKQVPLSRDNKSTRVCVARLMYEAFIGPIPERSFVTVDNNELLLENLRVVEEKKGDKIIKGFIEKGDVVDLSIREANELYKMYLEDEQKYLNERDYDNAVKSRVEAELIKNTYMPKICKTYKEGDKVDKSLLKNGELTSLQKDLLKEGLKICAHCDSVLSIKEFGKHSKASDGLQSWCKRCRYETRKKRIDKNKKPKKNSLDTLSLGTYVSESMMTELGYTELRGLNKGLYGTRRKVCGECRIVTKRTDFKHYSDGSTSSVCNHCLQAGKRKVDKPSNQNSSEVSSSSLKERAQAIRNNLGCTLTPNGLIRKHTNLTDNLCIMLDAESKSLKVGTVLTKEYMSNKGYTPFDINPFLVRYNKKICLICNTVLDRSEDFYNRYDKQEGTSASKCSYCKHCSKAKLKKRTKVKKTLVEDVIKVPIPSSEMFTQNNISSILQYSWVCGKCGRSINPKFDSCPYCDPQ